MPVFFQVDGLDPCRARALYQSGMKTPNDVLNATDEAVKRALSKAMPSELKRRDGAHVQKGTNVAVQVGLGAHIGMLLPHISQLHCCWVAIHH